MNYYDDKKELFTVKKLYWLVFISFVFLLRVNFCEASTVEQAFKNNKSDIQVKGIGTVIRLLKDDNQGSRHQKFILKLASRQTVLIVHNIDIAPRINNIVIGDIVQFYGEYEWNKKGGLVHWTHRDPNNHHLHGWLKHKESVYQ